MVDRANVRYQYQPHNRDAVLTRFDSDFPIGQALALTLSIGDQQVILEYRGGFFVVEYEGVKLALDHTS